MRLAASGPRYNRGPTGGGRIAVAYALALDRVAFLNRSHTMAPLRALIWTIGLSCGLPQLSSAQKGLLVYGVVTNHLDTVPLSGVLVTVEEEDGTLLHSMTTQDSGKYTLRLPYRRERLIVRFIKEGALPRSLAFDTRWIPKINPHSMIIDMSMLPIYPDRDHSFADQPCGRVYYNSDQAMLVFDRTYAEKMRPAYWRYFHPDTVPAK